MMLAMSPAANTCGCDTDCSRASTRMNPRSSVARPASFGHDGADAPVAQTIASASIAPPPTSRRRPLSTRSTARPRCTPTPRRSSTPAKIRRTRRLCPGRIVSQSPTRWNAISRSRQKRAQPMLHREQHLDPGGAAAHHRDRARALSTGDPPAHFIPPRNERLDGSYRQRVRCRAGSRLSRRAGARIHRNDVVRQRRAVVARHDARVQVHRSARRSNEAAAGEARERCEIDVAVVARVMPGDPAGKHSRVGEIGIRISPARARSPGTGSAPNRRSTSMWLWPPPSSTRRFMLKGPILHPGIGVYSWRPCHAGRSARWAGPSTSSTSSRSDPTPAIRSRSCSRRTSCPRARCKPSPSRRTTRRRRSSRPTRIPTERSAFGSSLPRARSASPGTRFSAPAGSSAITCFPARGITSG